MAHETHLFRPRSRPRRRSTTAVGLSCLACALLPMLLASGATAERSEEPAKDCVRVSTRSPYIPYGYDHVVVLKNTCDKAQRCEVSTDATPTTRSVTVKAMQTREVVTRRGSPARTFNASVSCGPS